ncbi:MAG: hypothetical protein KC613_10305 [Myxococcales bacterium]|nr:hypothetical protein [Myxococcales bacterium]MCB9525015.1 hypothetical protein [Myxococcales bacterium]
MTAWLVLMGLLAAPPPPWVERDGPRLRITADLRPWFAPAPVQAEQPPLRTRLTSGLTTSLRFWIEIRDRDGRLAGVSLRRVRVRWHLWDERFTTVIEDAHGARTPAFKDLPSLLDEVARFDQWPVDADVPSDDRVYRVEAVLEVNPVTPEQAARMRRWLASPQAPARLDPLGGGLLGSFVRFFDNFKPGPVEARFALEGPWFRADRLPWFGRGGPK